jgi:hypothetical protein
MASSNSVKQQLQPGDERETPPILATAEPAQESNAGRLVQFSMALSQFRADNARRFPSKQERARPPSKSAVADRRFLGANFKTDS